MKIVKALIILVVFLVACNEMGVTGEGYEAGGEGDTDTGAYWDCENLCDVEAECAEDNESYAGWDYCVEVCEETILDVEEEQGDFVDCIFDCGWGYPGDYDSKTYESCHSFTVCVASCYGETG